jgi:dTDP-glucose 4,6-dehydratase
LRLLVTGGAGFIGSAFVRLRLRSTDDAIVILDKLTYAGSLDRLADVRADPATGPRLELVEGDILDVSLVESLVEVADAVVNFAAESHVDRSLEAPHAFATTNIVGVYVLLEAIRRAQAGSARSIRMVQVSTDEVYGHVAAGIRRESDPVAPTNPYAATKASADLVTLGYHATYAVDCVITRGVNTFGPFQHPEKLIPLLITNALRDSVLPLYGDGMQQRDWLYVTDHAEAVARILDHGDAGQIYNIDGTGQRDNRSIAQAVVTMLGRDPALIRSIADRAGHDRRYAVDATRLRAIGWQPQVSFDHGLAQTVAWYVRNEEWWRRMKSGPWQDYYARQYDERIARSVPLADE